MGNLVGGCQRVHQAPGNCMCFFVLNGVGMSTFFGLAHLHDATLMHVLFNVQNYAMLRWQFLLHLRTVVMLRWQDLLLHLHTVVMPRWPDLLLHLHTVVLLRWQDLLLLLHSAKLSKIAGTQQIDRQWLGLKKFVFFQSSQKSEDFGGVRGESISATSLLPIWSSRYMEM